MRLEQFEQLVQIYKWGSFKTAAKYLGTTHQNITRSIKSLEEEFGCTLFDRSASGSTLTPEGRVVLTYAQNVIDGYYNTQLTIKRLGQASRSKNLRERSSVSFAVTVGVDSFSTPLVFNLLRKAEIYISFDTISPQEYLDQVGSKNAPHDYYLVQQSEEYLLEHTKPASQFHLFIIMAETPVLCTSKNSIYAQRESISIPELKTIPLMALSKTTSVLDLVGFDTSAFNFVSRANVIAAAKELLRSGRVNMAAIPSSVAFLAREYPGETVATIPIECNNAVATALYIKKEVEDENVSHLIIDILQRAYCDSFKQIY